MACASTWRGVAVYYSRSTGIDAGVRWASCHCIYWQCSPPTCASFVIAFVVVTTTPEPTRTSPPPNDGVLQHIAPCKEHHRLQPPSVAISDYVTAFTSPTITPRRKDHRHVHPPHMRAKVTRGSSLHDNACLIEATPIDRFTVVQMLLQHCC
ncbi:hypothetical protein COCMIDRAFT_24391 [Bipolaris oryzae ATCC 44560]|uniref:Uncharacterized protein n=1 Tax=Bipolaris oryzae ATCC 44560 TaxID=930090 RepID=W6ZV95_COCMI|nr:uncharacterized protein COCMIDRAFT_24391 [Bipolaris oryzae ATCC 44560]EUC47681.1 hypothetical protein COCMIDRAFT_24391 [Bipolaris oryzae ATCC 44560]